MNDPIELQYKVVTASSQSSASPAENISRAETFRRWQTEAGVERASIEIEFPEPVCVDSVEIVNNGSAFIELKVGPMNADPADFEVLMPTSLFASMNDIAKETNLYRTKTVKFEKLTKSVAEKPFQRLQAVCTITFPTVKNRPVGLTSLRVFGRPADRPKTETRPAMMMPLPQTQSPPPMIQLPSRKTEYEPPSTVSLFQANSRLKDFIEANKVVAAANPALPAPPPAPPTSVNDLPPFPAPTPRPVSSVKRPPPPPPPPTPSLFSQSASSKAPAKDPDSEDQEKPPQSSKKLLPSSLSTTSSKTPSNKSTKAVTSTHNNNNKSSSSSSSVNTGSNKAATQKRTKGAPTPEVHELHSSSEDEHPQQQQPQNGTSSTNNIDDNKDKQQTLSASTSTKKHLPPSFTTSSNTTTSSSNTASATSKYFSPTSSSSSSKDPSSAKSKYLGSNTNKKTSTASSTATAGAVSSSSSTGPSSVDVPFNKILAGVRFVMSGYQNPLRGQLRDKALAMGAKYAPDWEPGCTHLICAFVNTPKYVSVKALGGTIVSHKWIEDCYSEKKHLPAKEYSLENDDDDDQSPKQKSSKRKKDDDDNDSNDNDVSGNKKTTRTTALKGKRPTPAAKQPNAKRRKKKGGKDDEDEEEDDGPDAYDQDDPFIDDTETKTDDEDAEAEWVDDD